jgi:site-specific DNA-methyltransferase (cytosine-N4-specific)
MRLLTEGSERITNNAMIRKSDLPFGSEFSPSQINLPELLEIIHAHQGDTYKLEAAILNEYFARHSQMGSSEEGSYNRAKLANNCKLGLIAYRIIDRETRFTDVGNTLYALRADEATLYTALAKHILLQLNGMTLVQCIQDMRIAGEDVNLTTLREGLAARGVHYPPGGKHPSMMRLWLAKAGVFIGKSWQVDDLRLKVILGADRDQFDILSNLTGEQRAFLRALANSLFHSTRLVYSRWQVQCKNTDHVSLDDVAKEVGLTHFLCHSDYGYDWQRSTPLCPSHHGAKSSCDYHD